MEQAEMEVVRQLVYAAEEIVQSLKRGGPPSRQMVDDLEYAAHKGRQLVQASQ